MLDEYFGTEDENMHDNLLTKKILKMWTTVLKLSMEKAIYYFV